MMSRAMRYPRSICIPYSPQGGTVPLFATRLQRILSIRMRSSVNATHRAMSSSQWTSTPREFLSPGFDLIEPSLQIEEETLPTYHPQKYYPVQQGEVLGGRYQVIAKLGYGVTSTVWFARDLSDSRYVILKTSHPGRRFIRRLFDYFSIDGPFGCHICLVHEPLGISANELMEWIPGHAMTLEDLKPCIRQLLLGLDFLHTESHIIHTDLQLKNLLLPPPDVKVLSEFEEQEIRRPSARKVLEDRTIYRSSKFPPSSGLPLLSDFGEARFGDEEHNEDIMPNVYRAPEVILKANWNYKVDIWNIAVLAWDIVCSRTLFDGKNTDGIFDDRFHLAELVALLGPPPPEFRERVKLSSVFWDETGTWKGLAPLPDITLEKLATNIRGEDREGFLRWLRSALQWDPKDRPTAKELLYDEWMMKGLKLTKTEENPSSKV